MGVVIPKKYLEVKSKSLSKVKEDNYFSLCTCLKQLGKPIAPNVFAGSPGWL